MSIELLQERIEELNTSAQALQATAQAEKRDLSDDERRDLDSLMSEFDRLAGDISRAQKLEEQTVSLAAPAGRKTAPNQTAAAVLSATDPDEDDVPDDAPTKPTRRLTGNGQPTRNKISAVPISDRKWGWPSMGDFALGVKKACSRAGTFDPRLERSLAAATTYGNEGSGSDGGYAVPPDFKNEIMSKVFGEDSLLSRTDQLTTSGNSMTFPKDETTDWQTTGGILAYWGTEAGVKTQSKPALEQSTVPLNKLYALVPVTDELMDDAPAMDAYLRRKAPAKINFKVNLAIVQGSGSGQPLGILNAPSTVSVAKVTSQVADTVVGANILAMHSRLYAPLRPSAVWLINQDIEPYLHRLSLPGLDDTGAVVTGWGTQVYLPPGGLSGAPYGTLMGRPVIPTQACETLGDRGDIILVDLKSYITITKAGGSAIRTDVSMHLWFDQDLTAYRFVMRVGGLPWWTAPISPRDGTNTMSWAVTLDAR